MNLLVEGANGRIGVSDGRIVAPDGDFDRCLQIAGAEIRPGLINAHDHLHRNHYGRLGSPPYANAYAWAADIQIRHAARIAEGRAVPRRQALLSGAWKNLLSGVTHVVHHDSWETDFDHDFPLCVVRLDCSDSLGMQPDLTAPTGRFALHLAEGVDDTAAQEVRLAARCGFLTPDFLAVHAVGPDDDGVATLRASGCAMIWCPTSNCFLFGRSAPPALLAEGMDVLLGSDSLLSGTGTLLDELRAARGVVADSRLEDAVGAVAARRLGIAAPALAIGAPADLVVLRRPLLSAHLEDVALVIAGGKLRVLDPEFIAIVQPQGGQIVEYQGVRRWISAAK